MQLVHTEFTAAVHDNAEINFVGAAAAISHSWMFSVASDNLKIVDI